MECLFGFDFKIVCLLIIFVVKFILWCIIVGVIVLCWESVMVVLDVIWVWVVVLLMMNIICFFLVLIMLIVGLMVFKLWGFGCVGIMIRLVKFMIFEIVWVIVGGVFIIIKWKFLLWVWLRLWKRFEKIDWMNVGFGVFWIFYYFVKEFWGLVLMRVMGLNLFCFVVIVIWLDKVVFLDLFFWDVKMIIFIVCNIIYLSFWIVGCIS